MNKTIKPEALSAALAQKLTIYHRDVIERVNEAGAKAAKALVKKTKATAPVGDRGKFKKAITYTEKTNTVMGDKEYTWGAGGKEGRLTHLLVRGHATKNGGRTKGDPFLENALDQVLPEYETNVEEALKNGN